MIMYRHQLPEPEQEPEQEQEQEPEQEQEQEQEPGQEREREPGQELAQVVQFVSKQMFCLYIKRIAPVQAATMQVQRVRAWY